MKNHWLDEVKKRLQHESSLPSGVALDRLQEEGIINERGEVTGHLRRWDAFLAVTEVKHSSNAQEITSFRCLKPVFGMPGGAMIDVSRESLVEYLQQGKKIITALHNDKLAMWKEENQVRLSPKGFIRISLAEDGKDDLGDLPEIAHPNSSL